MYLVRVQKNNWTIYNTESEAQNSKGWLKFGRNRKFHDIFDEYNNSCKNVTYKVALKVRLIN